MAWSLLAPDREGEREWAEQGNAMFLTITTTHRPATELGFLLHKHPDRIQEFELSFGHASVFYPEAGPERATAALLVEVDPVGLVRKEHPRSDGAGLFEYVNDRPYAASSFLSVAIAQVFGTALAGRCGGRPELASVSIPLSATLPALPCRGGEGLLHRLFEPLGYRIASRKIPLDERFPDWGPSRYLEVTLEGTLRLSDLLSHLYVLIPVLDDEKHYWVGEDEIEKLLRHAGRWLADHPAREEITHRYLKRNPRLTREALSRLLGEEDEDPDAAAAENDVAEARLETPVKLNDARLGAVVAILRESGARQVLDLGCGEGKLLVFLSRERSFEKITGLDVSVRALEIAARRLERIGQRDVVGDNSRGWVRLLHGSLVYRDARLQGHDAAAIVEVIEHLDPPRLRAFERTVFEFARPETVVITTPNAEYNVRFEELPAGKFRHADHRFEWTRAELRTWAKEIAARHGYSARFLGVGPEDPLVGPPTQIAVFRRGAAEETPL